MRILLYDVDSVIPNIALMKISTYHKNLKNNVELIRGEGKPTQINYANYDKGYASVVFTKHKDLVKDFPWNVGGTGFSLEKVLPDYVEHLMPDYSLYTDNEYSIGFLTRGCCRNCEFCVVPTKEGMIRFNASVREFMNPDFKKIRILDNNLLAYKDWEKCLIELKETKKKIKFENFDFRLLTEKQIQLLSKIRIDGDYIFALDDPANIDYFEKKMWMLEKYLKPWRAKFYVLVGYDTTLEEGIKRIKFLYSHKVLPYIMRHENYKNSAYKNFYIDLSAFCNQVFFFKQMDFKHFMTVRYKEGHPRIQAMSNLFEQLWDKT